MYIYILGGKKFVEFLMPSNGKNATNFFSYLIYTGCFKNN